ncbi:hypothetical protein HYH02_006392 [Chlamydomonas schloesseri]|uniref:Alpha-type protein kinase domain-containing protein n=1 Tax=Chlamydomonas schloesseri TaxID=2026947 RepID=A0A835WK15_9CHLO|nr:hypothetical protein HYH02_006392 [Chlamydomonas schloesseri]|eukprot:KAG2448501.1 hypothetical protein HYH02_006392 [Chlamydomonas schloesseri]
MEALRARVRELESLPEAELVEYLRLLDEYLGAGGKSAVAQSRSHKQRTPSARPAPVARPASAAPPLATSAITLISHTHGRERREQRGIERRELQEAVKYGRKERANPGRDGQVRWRYTHKGVVYITDESSRHEITSWRLDDAPDVPPAAIGPAGGGTAHVIVVVDHSGSMRKDDVPGYVSRTEAVYDCLARDLVEPQLKLEGGSRMEISLIEMQDEAEVVLCRRPPDSALLDYLKGSGQSYARSHGNYLPALDAALELMREDAARQKQLFLVFLSDGAPSDHTTMACEHGIRVWQEDPNGGVAARGRPRLNRCPYSSGCRALVRQVVQANCLDRIRTMGDLLGRDRVSVNTVAFGPAAEDFAVLQAMSKVLPRGSFQKLGLSANCLRTAFTSLTSSLTTLRTEAGGGGGGGPGLTLRTDLRAKGQRQEYEEHQLLTHGIKFDIYVGKNCLFKRQYDRRIREMVSVPFLDTFRVRALRLDFPHLQWGVAHARRAFSEGAERVVFQCTEVVSVDGGATAYAVGPRLVAKQSRHQEHLFDPRFHRTFCRTQGEAAELAALFNRRLGLGPAWQVHFLPCYVYKIVDDRYSYAEGGQLEILVEEELEGKFTKWNNNAGGVGQGRLGLSSSNMRNSTARNNNNTALGAIAEDEEEEESDEDAEEDARNNAGGGPAGGAEAHIEDVPQAFSHFTWDCTEGRKLVCDLQGVWNSTDGFTLTDPVIHHASGGRRNGATDKGQAGMCNFFATHACNALCRQLGLRLGPVR